MILLNIAEKAGWFAQNFLCNLRIDRTGRPSYNTLAGNKWWSLSWRTIVSLFIRSMVFYEIRTGLPAWRPALIFYGEKRTGADPEPLSFPV